LVKLLLRDFRLAIWECGPRLGEALPEGALSQSAGVVPPALGFQDLAVFTAGRVSTRQEVRLLRGCLAGVDPALE
jgi:hypothetical protein